MVEPGLYRHFKGGRYLVLGEAKHTEGGEPVVVYLPLYNARELMVRPVEKFIEPLTASQRKQHPVLREGKTVPYEGDRFQLEQPLTLNGAVVRLARELPP